MKETQIQDNLIQPTLTIRYITGEAQSLIELVDKHISQLVLAAIKIVVSKDSSIPNRLNFCRI